MAFKCVDLVHDLTTTTGTGALTLANTPPANRQAFGSVLSSGDTCAVAIISRTQANEWEVTFSTFTSPLTLSRDSVIVSSNGGSPTVFSAGIKDVFITHYGGLIPYLSASGNLVLPYGVRVGNGDPYVINCQGISFFGDSVQVAKNQSGATVVGISNGNATGAIARFDIQAGPGPDARFIFSADSPNATTFAGELIGNLSIFTNTSGKQIDFSTTDGSSHTATVRPDGTFFTAGIIRTPGIRRVGTQFDKTTNTTLSDVTDLSVTLASGRLYIFRGTLYCTCDAAGGAKMAIGGTATAIGMRAGAKTYTGTTLNTQNSATALATAFGASTTAVDRIDFDGSFYCNAGGTLTVQFAQNAANNTSSVLTFSQWEVWESFT